MITVGHRNEFRIATTFQTVVIYMMVSFPGFDRGLSFNVVVFTMVDETEKRGFF